MKNRLFCLALCAALLAACSQSDAPDRSSVATVADIIAPASEIAATPKGDAVLMNGYVPYFPHKVRSMRDEGTSHFVVLEYIGVDRDAAIAALSGSLEGENFAIAGPLPREAAIQYIYVNRDGRRLNAIFSDPGTQSLVNPGAQGVAMFSWTDKVAN